VSLISPDQTADQNKPSQSLSKWSLKVAKVLNHALVTHGEVHPYFDKAGSRMYERWVLVWFSSSSLLMPRYAFTGIADCDEMLIKRTVKVRIELATLEPFPPLRETHPSQILALAEGKRILL
jgi:hypothetical protein